MKGQNLYRWILGAAIAASFFMHLPFLNLPPHSQHVWRQTFTLAVAENFYEEDMNLFAPRINQRMAASGVTGMHFPLYEWGLAAAYHLTGNEFWVHRLWSWLLSLLGAFAMWRIAFHWWKNRGVATFAFVFYLFSPEIFYDGWIALPDILALPLCLWGLHFFYRYREKRRYGLLAFSAVLFMLGGLVKLQYLGIGFFIAGTLWHDRKQMTLRQWISMLAFGLVAVAPVLGWYRYASELIRATGMADVGLETKPAESLEKAWLVLSKNLFSDIPEILLSYVTLFGVLYMLFRLIRYEGVMRHWLFFPFLFFVLGFAVYHFLELRVLEHHPYYMLPYLALLIPLGAKGIYSLCRERTVLMVVLLSAQVILCGLRMIPARFTHPDKHIPSAFWEEDSRNQLQNAVPEGSLSMVGPDPSMCIYFYFLHQKGWNYTHPGQLMEQRNGNEPYIAVAIRAGCRYLFTSEKNIEKNQNLRPYLRHRIHYIDGFSVYELGLPPAE